jgi:hypothetical protein
MKYQPGDKIIVLHTDEEGEVIEILNEKMVMIEVRGVRFPAYMDQIDFPYFKRFTQKKPTPPPAKKYIDDVRKEKPQPTARKADGCWLSLLPVTDIDEFGDVVVELIKVYLINHTPDSYIFNYNLNFMGDRGFDLKNTLLPFQDFYVHDIAFSEFSDSPKFEIRFELTQPDKNKAKEHTVVYKIKPKTFFEQLSQVKAGKQATITHLLFAEYPPPPVETGFDLSILGAKGLKIQQARKPKNSLPAIRTVIDLHADKLSDDHEKMSSGEIIDMQLREFEKWFDLAVAHHQSFLIVVHGVGSGRLRDEIHEFLKYRNEVKSFVNQYHPSFGYGATEITFNN